MEEDFNEDNSNSINRDNIFALLTEMFGDVDVVTPEIVLKIGETNNWKLQSCIDDMLDYVKNSHNKKEKTSDNNSQTMEQNRPKFLLSETSAGNIQELNHHQQQQQQQEDDNSSPDVIIESEEIAMSCDNDESCSKSLGAIPKITNNNNNNCLNKTLDFSKIFEQGFKEFNLKQNDNSTHERELSPKKQFANSTASAEVQKIIETINKGYKIMIIMRGVPGCGKSYLSRYIIDKTIGNGDYANHIFSSDDYFYVGNEYVYRRNELSDAHEFNQKRVREKATEGWSPIIVDNTNVKIWEMLPYVQAAVNNGYLIEILQPNNEWCRSAGKLAKRNSHGVPKDKIERMMQNFEPVTLDELIKIAKVQYSSKIPQLRRYPALKSNTATDCSNYQLNYEDNLKMQTNNDSNSSAFQSSITDGNTKNSETQWSTELSNFSFDRSKLLDNIVQNEISSTISKNPENKTNYNNELENEEKWTSYDDVQKTNETIDERKNSQPKPARNSPRVQRRQKCFSLCDDNLDLYLPGMRDSDWTSYEEESNKFWGVQKNENNNKSLIKNQISEEAMSCNNSPKPKRYTPNKSEDSTANNLYLLLKSENEKISTQNDLEMEQKLIKDDNNLTVSENKLEKHKIGCINESKSFIMLRQIYQNKQLDGLWDLYEKCGGNVNWVIDILVNDNDACEDQQYSNKFNSNEYFQCNCDVSSQQINNNNDNNISNNDFNNQFKDGSPPEKIPRYKVKKDKFNNCNLPQEVIELKNTIEKQIQVSNQYYPEHVQKIRNLRYGCVQENNEEINVVPETISKIPIENENSIENQENDVLLLNQIEKEENSEMIEIDLGEQLISQLEQLFSNESYINYNKSNYKTNVFMPKNFAKQLYAFWMESLYNQMEEQKNDTIKNDEEYARFLQNSIMNKKLFDTSSSSSKNFKDIMDMELAWSFYKSDSKKWKDKMPCDLASHLTRLKLCEMFPNIDENTLLEILAAHGNKFSDTVEILKESLKENPSEDIQMKGIELMKKVNDETENSSKIITTTTTTTLAAASVENQFLNKKLDPEEAKKEALKLFEENRNLAAHHTQLKCECHQKAKQAIQNGNHSVAFYYSQVANLHRSKIEKYDQIAASALIEMQTLNQDDRSILDLHYLNTAEAIECFDVFLDKHIAKLKQTRRYYRYVYIITGRGAHSTGGFSTIKNNVIRRLAERNLSWSESNPGLLKIRVYCGSKFSKNV